jgi:hypothetical protein
MRKTIFMYVSIIVCYIANLPTFGASFMEALKAIPLLDGKSLSGSVVISTPFEISTVGDQRQPILELEDTLRSLAAGGESSLNSHRAINNFARLNEFACKANYFAVGFFIRLFQDGTLGGRTLPDFSKQPERAAFFISIREFIADLLDAKTQAERDIILRDMNNMLTKHVLYDCILVLEQKEFEEYNGIISKIIEILVTKFGKPRAVLAETFGISRSSTHRIYHRQAFGKKATSRISVGAELTAQAGVLQDFLELTEEEYSQFITELFLFSAKPDSLAEVELLGLRRRHIAANSKKTYQD